MSGVIDPHISGKWRFTVGKSAASNHGHFTSGYGDHNTHRINIWVVPKAGMGLFASKNIFPLSVIKLRFLGLPACIVQLRMPSVQ
jgi:hypothetical protein